MNTFAKLFVRVNAFLYKITNGRVGGHMGSQSVLLLHSIGRQSGKTYIRPISFYRDGENYLVVASNWGSEKLPDWLQNLLAQPQTQIQIQDKTYRVTARLADDTERERLWKLVTARNPQFLEYQAQVKRRIPVVILHPAGDL